MRKIWNKVTEFWNNDNFLPIMVTIDLFVTIANLIILLNL